MPSRSTELMLTGYYLSRFGINNPPPRFTTNWQQTYFAFYDSLNDGRTVLEFEHSLKNARDTFDGYFNNGRVGWLNASKTGPVELTGINLEIFKNYRHFGEEALWNLISQFANIEKSSKIREFLIGEDSLNSDSNLLTEGKTKVYISKTKERNSKLRNKAIQIHGLDCMVCGFNFEKSYGKIGKGFIEVHHVIPISSYTAEKPTNPETDLSVLCSNCHRMIHHKKGYVFSIKELQQIKSDNY